MTESIEKPVKLRSPTVSTTALKIHAHVASETNGLASSANTITTTMAKPELMLTSASRPIAAYCSMLGKVRAYAKACVPYGGGSSLTTARVAAIASIRLGVSSIWCQRNGTRVVMMLAAGVAWSLKTMLDAWRLPVEESRNSSKSVQNDAYSRNVPFEYIDPQIHVWHKVSTRSQAQHNTTTSMLAYAKHACSRLSPFHCRMSSNQDTNEPFAVIGSACISTIALSMTACVCGSLKSTGASGRRASTK